MVVSELIEGVGDFIRPPAGRRKVLPHLPKGIVNRDLAVDRGKDPGASARRTLPLSARLIGYVIEHRAAPFQLAKCIQNLAITYGVSPTANYRHDFDVVVTEHRDSTRHLAFDLRSYRIVK
jgi:hypothetical protein